MVITYENTSYLAMLVPKKIGFWAEQFLLFRLVDNNPSLIPTNTKMLGAGWALSFTSWDWAGLKDVAGFADRNVGRRA